MEVLVEEHVVLETARLGDDMRRFLTSPLGDRLTSHIKNRITSLRDKAEQVNNMRELREVQSEIKALRTVLNHFAEVVVDGDLAVTTLNDDSGYQNTDAA